MDRRGKMEGTKIMMEHVLHDWFILMMSTDHMSTLHLSAVHVNQETLLLKS